MTNPITENLLWSWAGPYRRPMTFRELQTVTGMDSETIADALRSPHVEVVSTESGLAYQPSTELLRVVAWQWIQPFIAVEESSAPANIIQLRAIA